MRSYFRNLLVAFNRFFGSLFFNDPALTISAQCYVAEITSASNPNPWKIRQLRKLRRILDSFWPGHCERAAARAAVRCTETLARIN